MGKPTEEQMYGFLTGAKQAQYDKDRAAESAATGGYSKTYKKLVDGYYGPTK